MSSNFDRNRNYTVIVRQKLEEALFRIEESLNLIDDDSFTNTSELKIVRRVSKSAEYLLQHLQSPPQFPDRGVTSADSLSRPQAPQTPQSSQDDRNFQSYQVDRSRNESIDGDLTPRQINRNNNEPQTAINPEVVIKSKLKSNRKKKSALNLILSIVLIISLSFNIYSFVGIPKSQATVTTIEPENNVENPTVVDNSLNEDGDKPPIKENEDIENQEDIELSKENPDLPLSDEGDLTPSNSNEKDSAQTPPDILPIDSQDQEEINTDENENIEEIQETEAVEEIEEVEEVEEINDKNETLEEDDLNLPQLPDLPTQTDLPNESELEKTIRQKLEKITDRYQENLISNLRINYRNNRIVVIVNSNWEQIEDEDKQKLSQSMFLQAKSIDFYRFQLQEESGNLIARNASIGDNLIMINP